MYKKIFRSVCLTAFAVFIASLALIMGMLYQYFDGQLKDEIRTEASYLAHAVDISGQEYLTELSPGDKRITLIDADGTVLYDSEANPATMDITASGTRWLPPWNTVWGRVSAIRIPSPKKPSTVPSV